MTLEHLWSTWRSDYVGTLGDAAPTHDLTLFERILAAPGTDRDKFVVARGGHCFVQIGRASCRERV